MTERDAIPATGATAAPVQPPAAPPQEQEPQPAGAPDAEGEPTAEVPVGAAPPSVPGTPAAGRPSVRARGRGSLTRMGPWAPVAGALLGVVLGVVGAVL